MLTAETIDRLLTDESIYGIERVIWELIRDRFEELQRIDGLSITDRQKLDSIETGATKNKPDAMLQNLSGATGMLGHDHVMGLSRVAVSGEYADLAGTPPSFSGDYKDLTGKPVLFSGDYGDLQNKPTLFSGDYSQLTGKPTYSTVASTGAYGDLSGKPVLFDGKYSSLTEKPVLFDGTYNSLTGKPNLFNGDYPALTNKPVLSSVASSGDYNDLKNKPAIPTAGFSGNYADLTGKPTLFSGSYLDLSDKPVYDQVATSGNYADLKNKPVLFSGSYLDLTSKPAIPAPTTSATDLTAGTLANARLDPSVTKLGNSVNTASGLVQLTSNGRLPVLDGSQLINLPVQLPSVDSATLTGTGASSSPISVKLDSTGLITAIRNAISASGTGLSYNSATGVLTYTPAASTASTKTISANYTALATDDVLLMDPATTGVVITLPDALTVLNKEYSIKRITASLFASTIFPAGAQLIDGGNNLAVTGTRSFRIRAYKTAANLGAWVILGTY